MLRYTYRLAAKLGVWQAERLYNEISLPQLAAWIAYDQLDGIGNERAELRAEAGRAITAHTIYSMLKGKKGKNLKPIDFVPKLGESSPAKRRARQQSPDEMLAMVEALNAAFGGTDIRQERRMPSQVATEGR